MSSAFFARAKDDESPYAMLVRHDSLDWLQVFHVEEVFIGDVGIGIARVHVSTSHLHVTNADGDNKTVRLSQIASIVPNETGLVLICSTAAKSDGLDEANDAVEEIEIVTDDKNYIALHIFERQCRLLRQYASTLKQSLTVRMQKTLHVVHFNDVYHLPPFKPSTARGVVGGASRFHTVLAEIRENYNPLVLFSGDFMGPSLMSVITKGKQMVDALNFLGVHYGCYGNHEFDFGLRTLKEVIHGYTQGKHIYPGSQTTWIMSNMTEADGSPLGGAKKVQIAVWNGVRVGLLGLCENWLPQCAYLRPGEAHYHDIFAVGESMAQHLKEEDGCDVVLALTHNRLPIDKELMQRCPSIDFLLGGHDHFYKSDPRNRVLKSGQEFEYLSFVEFLLNDTTSGVSKVRIDTKPIMYDTPQSDYMKGLIERYDQKMREKLGKPIGTATYMLDSTEETIRFKECKLTNFILDIMQDESGADFAVLGAAAVAGKEEKPPGPVTIGDVFNWFPNDTKIMTIEVSGDTIQRMLDVMVRELPAEAPSFPHPSRNLSFTINMIAKPPRTCDVHVQGEPLDVEKRYIIAVEEFVGLGKAKYKFVPDDAMVIVSDDSAPQLVHWVMDYFTKRKGQVQSEENQAREEALKTISKVVASATRMEIDADVDKSQKFVRSLICQLLKCDRSSVFLVDKEKDQLYFTPDGSPNEIRFPRHVGLAGHVATSNEDLNIADVYDDPRFNRAIDKQTGYRTRSMLACPVCLVGTEVIAVVQAINKESDDAAEHGVFSDVDALMLRLLGEQVGFQLRNGEIFRMALSEAYDRTATGTLSGAFEQSMENNEDYLDKNATGVFKRFCGDVSVDPTTLLKTLSHYALTLVPCERVRVFICDPHNGGIMTLEEDVEDDETISTFCVEDDTTLHSVLSSPQTVILGNARDVAVLSNDRDAQAGMKSVMMSSMETAQREVVGAVVWINRKNPTSPQPRQFCDVDSFCAKYYGLFAAVSHQNTARIQNLNALREENNLQAVPDVELGRIKIRGGWATVRRNLDKIIAMGAAAHTQSDDADSCDQPLTVLVEVEDPAERSRRGSDASTAGTRNASDSVTPRGYDSGKLQRERSDAVGRSRTIGALSKQLFAAAKKQSQIDAMEASASNRRTSLSAGAQSRRRSVTPNPCGTLKPVMPSPSMRAGSDGTSPLLLELVVPEE